MPRTEPNSLSDVFFDWQDWRSMYATYVEDFNATPKTYSDEVLLNIRLKRLGFVSSNLSAELRHIKEGGT